MFCSYFNFFDFVIFKIENEMNRVSYDKGNLFFIN